MKKKEWNEGLNHLDPDLVEKHIEQKERLRQKNKKTKSVYLRFGAIAACFLLIVSTVIAVPTRIHIARIDTLLNPNCVARLVLHVSICHKISAAKSLMSCQKKQ